MSSMIILVALKIVIAKLAIRVATMVSDDCSVFFIRNNQVIKWRVRSMRKNDKFYTEGPYGVTRIVVNYKTIKKLVGVAM